MGNRQLTLVTPTVPLFEQLAETMALEDRQELWGYDHSTPLEGLQRSVSRSTESWCLVAQDGSPVCAFGIQSIGLLSKTACFWLLGSYLIPRYRRDFLRWNHALLRERGGQYDQLINCVGDWHTTSKRWLIWLGATLSDPFPYGVEQWLWRAVTKKGRD